MQLCFEVSESVSKRPNIVRITICWVSQNSIGVLDRSEPFQIRGNGFFSLSVFFPIGLFYTGRRGGWCNIQQFAVAGVGQEGSFQRRLIHGQWFRFDSVTGERVSFQWRRIWERSSISSFWRLWDGRIKQLVEF